MVQHNYLKQGTCAAFLVSRKVIFVWLTNQAIIPSSLFPAQKMDVSTRPYLFDQISPQPISQ